MIIPTINECEALPQTLRAIHSHSEIQPFELIVADGGSSDNTVQIAESFGAKVLHCATKGRGAQLHHGAKSASGELLYFLHADSIPPKGYDDAIRAAVKDGQPAGCFQMRFDSRAAIFRLYGWATRFSSIYCRGGDQSLFITREFYQRLGGFNTGFPIFEDIDMIVRIRKKGRFAILPQRVTTSARKYQVNGFYRLQAIFAVLHLKYRFGASPKELLSYYRKHIR